MKKWLLLCFVMVNAQERGSLRTDLRFYGISNMPLKTAQKCPYTWQNTFPNVTKFFATVWSYTQVSSNNKGQCKYATQKKSETMPCPYRRVTKVDDVWIPGSGGRPRVTHKKSVPCGGIKKAW